MTGITVGYDGSHNAQQALEWAMREAAFRHAPLTVLTVHPVAASGWTGQRASRAGLAGLILRPGNSAGAHVFQI